MTDDDLRMFVRDELDFDQKLDSEAIAVSADDGVITLRGTVGSFHEKLAAKSAAQRVAGVKRVENELTLRLMTGDARGDAELRGDVLQALMLNARVPRTVDATVDNGFVTLSGTAEWLFQRDEAIRVAAAVRGVLDVWDDVVLTGAAPDAVEVQHEITKALERSAKLDAKNLTVETSEHTVTLKGTVSSWAEHDEAVATAWAAPGVHKVKDDILVVS